MELLSVAIVGLMTAAVALWRVPASECPECDHCRTVRREAELRRQDEHHRRIHSWYGRESCPVCSQNPER